MKIASATSLYQWQCLLDFSDWLQLRKPFTYIVDGANVAYTHQNHDEGKFQYQQIEIVVNELKSRGEEVLVLLPYCYTQEVIPNSVCRKNGTKRPFEKTTDDDRVSRNNFLC